MPIYSVCVNLKDDHDLKEQFSTETMWEYLHQTGYAHFGYCLLQVFFICHSAKAYLGPFQTSRMDFLLQIILL